MRIAAWTGVLCSVLSPLAHAAGDRTQGSYVCGGKLELLPGGKPKGECLTVMSGVPSATATPTTLTLADSSTGSPVAVTTVNVANCSDKGAYWSCPNPVIDPKYCSGPPGFEVFILKAKLSKGGFTFSLGPPPQPSTLICSGNGGYGPTPSCTQLPVEPFSTAADCIAWNYGPTTANQRLFNACVRMARADYLGNGLSATRVGTHIQPGSSPADKCDCTDCESCMEAYWDEQGAVCIYHYRWQYVVANVAMILGIKQGAAEKLLGERFPAPVEYKKQKYRCRRGMTPEHGLLWNRSRIHLCSGSTLTIMPCKKGSFDPDCRPTPCPP